MDFWFAFSEFSAQLSVVRNHIPWRLPSTLRWDPESLRMSLGCSSEDPATWGGAGSWGWALRTAQFWRGFVRISDVSITSVLIGPATHLFQPPPKRALRRMGRTAGV